MRFKIGEKVALVPGAGAILQQDALLLAIAMGIRANVPVDGVVYTIRGGGLAAGGMIGVVLEEITNPGIPGRIPELHFDEACFAPVIKRDTSAAVEELKKLQDPANHKVFGSPRELELA